MSYAYRLGKLAAAEQVGISPSLEGEYAETQPRVIPKALVPVLGGAGGGLIGAGMGAQLATIRDMATHGRAPNVHSAGKGALIGGLAGTALGAGGSALLNELGEAWERQRREEELRRLRAFAAMGGQGAPPPPSGG